MPEAIRITNVVALPITSQEQGGGGVTPIRGMVYMCLPGLWVKLQYFARVMGHVL